MPIELTFIDWAKPALGEAARWFAERFGDGGNLDLSAVIVCVPGAQARRRLLELLVEVAGERGLMLAPPQIVTPGGLPELLYEAKQPFASDLMQQLAWVKVLQEATAAELAPLVRNLPEKDDLPGWLALGKMLSDLHRELSADGLDCAAVLKEGARCEGFNETDRWKLLAELERRYLRLLDGLQVWDKQTARLFAVAHRECRTEKRIVLVGLVDLNRSQRQMLDQVAERVTALVFAPPDSGARFDEHGCLRPEKWQDVVSSLTDEQIEIADGPGDQADAVVRALAALDGRYTAEEIVIGVPDPRLAPYVRQRLEESNLPARYANGAPLARIGPCQLLTETADYLERRRFSDLAALVRHPALAKWLRAKKIEADWLTFFDKFHTQRLPAQVPKEWSERAREVQGMILGRLVEFGQRKQPLDAWAKPILDLLTDIYGGEPLDENVEPDRTIILACGKIRDALKTHLEIGKSLSPVVSGASALRLLLRELQAETIPPQAGGAAIEMLGWLELIWDDAPALIVCGFNEGIISPSIGGDLFLPNALRQRLKLDDNERRLARDAYALGLLAASRERLHIIAGRRSAENDPLVPSRLLFACDDGELARRTLRLFQSPSESSRRILLPSRLRSGSEKSSLLVPKPDRRIEQSDAYRVTEFKDYLACPYRYFLRHRLKLEALADTATELDPGQFGSLLHDALAEFGRGAVKDSTSPEEIRGELFTVLGELTAMRFGGASQPAVLVQIELLKMRLQAFAERQARRRQQGWRIMHVEKEFGDKEGCEKAAPLVVDGQAALLRGRVDRIDQHEQTQQWAVLDYKSSETANKPNDTHRDHDAWTDLQLPLYRHLVRGLGIKDNVQLGYIQLPKDVARTDFALAEWTADELRVADEAAAEVIRQIRKQGKILAADKSRSGVFRRFCRHLPGCPLRRRCRGRRRDRGGRRMTRLKSPFPHVVIRASAGTGKTFQLSNRFLGLTATTVPPDQILATTFARKAAAEILDRVMTRLAEAIESSDEMVKLSGHLQRPELGRPAAIAMLRSLIQRLHRLQIGTLDSFFVQLAHSFSLELGLPLGWRIVDPLEDRKLRNDAIQAVLAGQTVEDSVRLVHLLSKGEATRSVTRQIEEVVDSLHDLFLSTEKAAWETIPRPKRLEETSVRDALTQLATIGFPDKRFISARDKNLESAAAGNWDAFVGGGLAEKIIAGVTDYYKKPIEPHVADAYRPLIEHARAELLGRLANQTEGTWQMLARFDAAYRQLKTAERALRFDDVTRALATGVPGRGVEELAYRLDGPLAHLLLDEFQDTSQPQWNVLKPFAKRVASGGGRSFFCVGDTKQAIYGWRGGVAEIFDSAIKELPDIVGRSLDESFRSAQVVIDTVNQVFADLPGNAALSEYGSVMKVWHGRYQSHTTSKKHLAGRCRLLVAKRAEDGEKQDVMTLRFAADHIAVLARQHPDRTIGVLVRRNVAVARLIYELRQRDVFASEEGGNPLTDSAAVQLVLSLLKLADHPGDTAARFHVATSPLAATVGLARYDDDAAARETALRVRERLLGDGYGRTIYEWVKSLAPVCDLRDLNRLLQLVELAYRLDDGKLRRPDDFIAQIESQRVEDPTAAKVRVMTVHQAKGLQFDIVVLPELDGNVKPQPSRVVIDRAAPLEPIRRVCRYASEKIQKLLPADFQKMFATCSDPWIGESLCVLYVAMTRAVHALDMIIAPSKVNEKTWPKTYAGVLRGAAGGGKDRRAGDDSFRTWRCGVGRSSGITSRAASAPG